MLEQERAIVLNGDGQPLGTTKSGRAGYLIRKGKARFVQPMPFTIQLTYTVPNPVMQKHTLGIDDGAKTAGIVVIAHNQTGDAVVLKTEVALRSDVTHLMGFRRSRRQGRRSHLRHRQPRSRRGNKNGQIPPSIRVRKDNVLREAQDLARLLPITRIVYEEGQFDTRALWDANVTDYQSGPNSGFENRKKAVLWRDKYICRYCGVDCIEAGVVAEVDHILPRSRGGTAAWRNLVCACRDCNQKKGSRTAAEFGHPETKGTQFKYPAHLQVGKTYIKEELAKLAPVEVVYGWQTSARRKRLGLDKSHVNDAIGMAAVSPSVEDDATEYRVVARRRRRSMQNLRHEDGYAGFRHWDVVRWERRDGQRPIGTVRSFVPAHNTVKCRFDFDDNVGVSAGRLRLVYRPRSLVYVPQSNRKEPVPQSARRQGDTV